MSLLTPWRIGKNADVAVGDGHSLIGVKINLAISNNPCIFAVEKNNIEYACN